MVFLSPNYLILSGQYANRRILVFGGGRLEFYQNLIVNYFMINFDERFPLAGPRNT